MASTYKLISSVTVGAGATSTIAFTSIPATYTDLVFRLSIRNLAAGIDEQLRVNFNNTGVNANTLNKVIQGNGLGSVATANSSTWIIGGYNGNGTTANTFTDAEVYIPNYLSSLNKNFYVDSTMETNGAQCYTEITAAVWQNTAAITSVAFSMPSVNFAQYSTAYLYGIEIPAQQITPKATGGDITFNDTHVFHTFRQSGTFTPLQSLTAEVLVVAGGGGAANAGGGAGGVSYHSAKSLTATAHTVTVGAGGTGAAVNNNTATNGSNSVFSDITSNGGGADAGAAARSGGSGSGAYTGLGGASTQGNTGGATGYGNAGGDPAANVGGSGGGAGAAGTAGGIGGAGLNTWSSWATATLSGVSGYYAGGGGTYNYGNTVTTAGGAGGGGAGGGGNGTTNTGGGAGAGTTGGTGGSGIVIVKYLK